MRITELTPEVQEEILTAWRATLPRMFDNERSMEALVHPIVNEPHTQWYTLGNGSFMILRNAVIGGSANLQFISPSDETLPELESAREQLVEAMKQYRLKRINVTYPTVLPWRDFKLLGFKHEGRIRKSVLFDGEWIDAEILGALENEIGISRRRRRKRYRPKKQEKVNERTTSAALVGPTESSGGPPGTGDTPAVDSESGGVLRKREAVKLQHGVRFPKSRRRS